MALQLHSTSNVAAPCATDEQIRKAAALMKRIDLKDFSVCQFANPGMLLHGYEYYHRNDTNECRRCIQYISCPSKNNQSEIVQLIDIPSDQRGNKPFLSFMFKKCETLTSENKQLTTTQN